jgi:hypothetical protein
LPFPPQSYAGSAEVDCLVDRFKAHEIDISALHEGMASHLGVVLEDCLVELVEQDALKEIATTLEEGDVDRMLAANEAKALLSPWKVSESPFAQTSADRLVRALWKVTHGVAAKLQYDHSNLDQLIEEVVDVARKIHLAQTTQSSKGKGVVRDTNDGVAVFKTTWQLRNEGKQRAPPVHVLTTPRSAWTTPIMRPFTTELVHILRILKEVDSDARAVRTCLRTALTQREFHTIPFHPPNRPSQRISITHWLFLGKKGRTTLEHLLDDEEEVSHDVNTQQRLRKANHIASWSMSGTDIRHIGQYLSKEVPPQDFEIPPCFDLMPVTKAFIRTTYNNMHSHVPYCQIPLFTGLTIVNVLPFIGFAPTRDQCASSFTFPAGDISSMLRESAWIPDGNLRGITAQREWLSMYMCYFLVVSHPDSPVVNRSDPQLKLFKKITSAACMLAFHFVCRV